MYIITLHVLQLRARYNIVQATRRGLVWATDTLQYYSMYTIYVCIIRTILYIIIIIVLTVCVYHILLYTQTFAVLISLFA